MNDARVTPVMVGRVTAIVALLLFGCGGASPRSTVAQARLEPGRERRALVIGIDGLRPDALTAARTPQLDSLFAGGLSTLRGTTQLDGETSSAPGWASVLTGVDAGEHGVLRNGLDPTIRLDAHPTFLARAARAGHRVGIATQDPRIITMLEPELAADARGGNGDEVTRAGAELLADEGLHLVFVVLEDIDDAGHATGFSRDNPIYVAAVERVDTLIGILLESMHARSTFGSEDWLVVVTSDHGGEGRSHGARTPANRTIPIAYANPHLRRGELGEAHRSHVHVAPTVLAWLAGDAPEALRPLR